MGAHQSSLKVCFSRSRYSEKIENEEQEDVHEESEYVYMGADLSESREEQNEMIHHYRTVRDRLQSDAADPYRTISYLDPSNFSPESLDSWHDVDRCEAEEALLRPGVPLGAFLLRRPHHRNRNQSSYVLSVRADGDTSVKHFLVKPLVGGEQGFCIDPKRKFGDIQSLLDYYSEPGKGKLRLSSACPHLPATLKQLSEIEVSRERIVIGDCIGKGSFGKVYKAQLDGCDVAVKEMSNKKMKRDCFLQEAENLRKLQHDRILKLHGVCTVINPIYIITELMCNGDLHRFLLLDREIGKIKFPSMIDILLQVCKGMSYLESKNYTHRDLRAANILVGDETASSFLVKIADFGLSKLLDDDYSKGNSMIPVRWAAPEVLKAPPQFSTKSDVWSFGILTFEVVTKGDRPFTGKDIKEVKKIVMDGDRLSDPKALKNKQDNSFIYEKIMSKCWLSEPQDRISFGRLEEVLKSYVFSESSDSYFAEDFLVG